MPIRVLVVDDSLLIRRFVKDILSRDPEFEIVGEAADGVEAVEKIMELSPDVVILDLEMPKKNGIEVIREVMAKKPTRILVFSSHTKEGAEITTTALTSGAIDFVFKPSWSHIASNISEFSKMFIEKVKLVARSKIPTPKAEIAETQPSSTSISRPTLRKEKLGIVAIASSTGGPRALTAVVPKLPEDMPVPVVIVQHMPAGFTKSLAERLNKLSKLTVKEGEDGEPVKAGYVYIAPGGIHMRVSGGRIELFDGPQVKGVKPAADVLFDSVGREYKKQTLGVILTGIGDDGTDGARVIKQFGGKIFAESEETALIYGMPKAVVKAGLADKVVPLHQMADEIVKEVRKWI
ncbi:chemotaxis-specific protein-glutamate methyltransferase CheB [bacterium 3DAC]|nr:chemotaxis-specific protein-glutamate methyltransferase CheB [bacterium 3DAC]